MLNKTAPRATGQFKTVLVTGGAGYVGSALVPRLLDKGCSVRVADLFWYGEDVFGDFRDHPSLELVKADIRDRDAMKQALRGMDAVIHLACISNDPSFELDPALGRAINLDAFPGIVRAARDAGARRFIYASSSSIYGVKDEPEVREDSTPEPLTDYSRFKLQCERILLETPADGMSRVIVRPATVCGYAPRLRLDLTVNILTIHALVNRKIRIFGGSQLRPNIHIADMVRAYEALLEAPAEKADGEAFNAGYQNQTVEEIARTVKDSLGDPAIEMEYVPSDDKRSYHISSGKIKSALGFEARHTIREAVLGIAEAHAAGRLTNPMENPLYYNIRRMRQLRPSPVSVS